MKLKLFSAYLFCLVLAATSCRKAELLRSNKTNNNLAQNSSMALSACDQFAYEDSIFYPQTLPSDYIVKPLVTQAGTYGAFPDGLKIGKTTGKIDITESETGLRYLVWFVPQGTTDTCIKYITVSGINFTDSIYVLKNQSGIAAPVYNANPNLGIADSSVFDDGPDSTQIIPQGVAIDKSSGKINLSQSITNGALGTNPISGTAKNFALNYRINDGSKKTLNKINFRLYYFKKQSQIPATLITTIKQKQAQVLTNNFNSNILPPAFYVSGVSLLEGRGAKEVKCRPPYIIVVAQ